MPIIKASISKLLFAVVLLFACTTTGSRAADHDHTKRTHHVVTIDKLIVHPRTLEITSEDVVVWSNYSGIPVQLRFPPETEGRISCAERPNFYKAGDGALVSRPIRSLEFAMPCKLKPGEYDYSILGTQGTGDLMQGPSPADPKGRIVVR